MVKSHGPVDRKAFVIIFPHGKLWVDLFIHRQSLFMIVTPASDVQAYGAEQLGHTLKRDSTD